MQAIWSIIIINEARMLRLGPISLRTSSSKLVCGDKDLNVEKNIRKDVCPKP